MYGTKLIVGLLVVLASACSLAQAEQQHSINDIDHREDLQQDIDEHSKDELQETEQEDITDGEQESGTEEEQYNVTEGKQEVGEDKIQGETLEEQEEVQEEEQQQEEKQEQDVEQKVEQKQEQEVEQDEGEEQEQEQEQEEEQEGEQKEDKEEELEEKQEENQDDETQQETEDNSVSEEQEPEVEQDDQSDETRHDSNDQQPEHQSETSSGGGGGAGDTGGNESQTTLLAVAATTAAAGLATVAAVVMRKKSTEEGPEASKSADDKAKEERPSDEEELDVKDDPTQVGNDDQIEAEVSPELAVAATVAEEPAEEDEATAVVAREDEDAGTDEESDNTASTEDENDEVGVEEEIMVMTQPALAAAAPAAVGDAEKSSRDANDDEADEETGDDAVKEDEILASIEASVEMQVSATSGEDGKEMASGSEKASQMMQADTDGREDAEIIDAEITQMAAASLCATPAQLDEDHVDGDDVGDDEDEDDWELVDADELDDFPSAEMGAGEIDSKAVSAYVDSIITNAMDQIRDEDQVNTDESSSKEEEEPCEDAAKTDDDSSSGDGCDDQTKEEKEDEPRRDESDGRDDDGGHEGNAEDDKGLPGADEVKDSDEHHTTSITLAEDGAAAITKATPVSINGNDASKTVAEDAVVEYVNGIVQEAVEVVTTEESSHAPQNKNASPVANGYGECSSEAVNLMRNQQPGDDERVEHRAYWEIPPDEPDRESSNLKDRDSEAASTDGAKDEQTREENRVAFQKNVNGFEGKESDADSQDDALSSSSGASDEVARDAGDSHQDAAADDDVIMAVSQPVCTSSPRSRYTGDQTDTQETPASSGTVPEVYVNGVACDVRSTSPSDSALDSPKTSILDVSDEDGNVMDSGVCSMDTSFRSIQSTPPESVIPVRHPVPNATTVASGLWGDILFLERCDIDIRTVATRNTQQQQLQLQDQQQQPEKQVALSSSAAHPVYIEQESGTIYVWVIISVMSSRQSINKVPAINACQEVKKQHTDLLNRKAIASKLGIRAPVNAEKRNNRTLVAEYGISQAFAPSRGAGGELVNPGSEDLDFVQRVELHGQNGVTANWLKPATRDQCSKCIYNVQDVAMATSHETMCKPGFFEGLKESFFKQMDAIFPVETATSTAICS